MHSIGDNIKAARKAKNLNQEQVAEKLGVSRSTYAEWERDTEPKVTMLIKIADVLGVSLVELVAGVVDENSIKKLTGNTQQKADYLRTMEILIDELAKLNASVFGETEAVYKKKIKKKIQPSDEKQDS